MFSIDTVEHRLTGGHHRITALSKANGKFMITIAEQRGHTIDVNNLYTVTSLRRRKAGVNGS